MIKKIVKKPILLVFVFFLLAALLVVWLVQKKPALKIEQTNPQDKETEVLVTTDILLIFNRKVEQEEQKFAKIEISPEIEYVGFWQDNQFTISPKKPLEKETEYEIKINLKEKNIHTFSFKTAPFTPEQIEEEGKLQSQDDLEFGEAFKKFIKDHPWYVHIPIETVEYRIVYDFEKDSFRIRIKVPVEITEEERMIEKALESLKKAGVPEPVSYYVLKNE